MRFESLHDLSHDRLFRTRPDQEAIDSVRRYQLQLTKPPGSLGRLEETVEFLAGWQRRAFPRLDRVRTLVFAGNHGICQQGVNPYPQSVTAQMVANFEAGGAAINQLCRAYGSELSVLSLRLDQPTADFSQAVALPPDECLEAINQGAGAVEPDTDLLILGEMGIGNSTVAAALCCALFGGPAESWVGPGTGSDGSGLARKIRAVESGMEFHRDRLQGPIEILQAFGGREQAALVGAILAARELSIPVILDGFICSAAAGIVSNLHASGLDHCLAGHCSAEPGHKRLLAELRKTPLLNLDMRLGEGTGALMALGLARGALACHTGMATFSSAGVDGSEASDG